jgi:hypothetical protein
MIVVALENAAICLARGNRSFNLPAKLLGIFDFAAFS